MTCDILQMDVAYAGAVFLATVWMTLTLYLPTILIEKHLRGSKGTGIFFLFRMVHCKCN